MAISISIGTQGRVYFWQTIEPYVMMIIYRHLQIANQFQKGMDPLCRSHYQLSVSHFDKQWTITGTHLVQHYSFTGHYTSEWDASILKMG